jgi:undecaprenyl pyrophosphate synthase
LDSVGLCAYICKATTEKQRAMTTAEQIEFCRNFLELNSTIQYTGNQKMEDLMNQLAAEFHKANNYEDDAICTTLEYLESGEEIPTLS